LRWRYKRKRRKGGEDEYRGERREMTEKVRRNERRKRLRREERMGELWKVASWA